MDTPPINTANFNRACFCVSLDRSALVNALEAQLGDPALFALVQARLPLFSAHPVVISQPQAQRMAELVAALESVVALPAYREEVLARSDPIARHPTRAHSVFMGYDFHLQAPEAQPGTGPVLGLIEVNTNAGGALLNALLARAQRACCAEVEPWMPTPAQVDAQEAAWVTMFRNEWRLGAVPRPLQTVAIVDAAPEQQHLYPEFLLFRALFERHGLQAVVADPSQLDWRGGRLWWGDLAIDLLYNRLTDFALSAPAHAHLREAYLQDAVLLTPHPQAHALFADKRNLALLSHPSTLQALGVPEATQATLLQTIPRTEVVNAANAERLWAQRKGHFFKPFAGYGGKAAYRGDKLTHRVWADIVAGGHIAQALVAPGERQISAAVLESPGQGGSAGQGATAGQVLKFDLRNYSYGGQVQALAARLYQGQITNMRTPGGGFAPVYVGP